MHAYYSYTIILTLHPALGRHDAHTVTHHVAAARLTLPGRPCQWYLLDSCVPDRVFPLADACVSSAFDADVCYAVAVRGPLQGTAPSRSTLQMMLRCRTHSEAAQPTPPSTLLRAPRPPREPCEGCRAEAHPAGAPTLLAERGAASPRPPALPSLATSRFPVALPRSPPAGPSVAGAAARLTPDAPAWRGAPRAATAAVTSVQVLLFLPMRYTVAGPINRRLVLEDCCAARLAAVVSASYNSERTCNPLHSGSGTPQLMYRLCQGSARFHNFQGHSPKIR